MTDSNRADERLKANDIACNLSHKAAIELASINNWPCVLVFEDDARLAWDFDLLLNDLLLNTPADFDMLFLNGTYGNHHKPEKFNSHLNRIFEMYGAFAYLVNQKFYSTLIAALEYYKEKMSTDYIYSFLFPKCKAYRAIKPIAFHAPGYSYRADRIEKMYKHLER